MPFDIDMGWITVAVGAVFVIIYFIIILKTQLHEHNITNREDAKDATKEFLKSVIEKIMGVEE